MGLGGIRARERISVNLVETLLFVNSSRMMVNTEKMLLDEIEVKKSHPASIQISSLSLTSSAFAHGKSLSSSHFSSGETVMTSQRGGVVMSCFE